MGDVAVLTPVPTEEVKPTQDVKEQEQVPGLRRRRRGKGKGKGKGKGEGRSNKTISTDTKKEKIQAARRMDGRDKTEGPAKDFVTITCQQLEPLFQEEDLLRKQKYILHSY